VRGSGMTKGVSLIARPPARGIGGENRRPAILLRGCLMGENSNLSWDASIRNAFN
jgi:hypothetical protein